MKKLAGITLFSAFVFLYTTGLFADTNPKRLVCIVRPILEKETAEFIIRMGKQIDSPELAQYAQGGYGSGFVYTGKNGTNYIITNRHVVAMAQKADLEFQTDEGTTTTIKECPVLYTDDDYDLAVIGIPGNRKPFKNGLDISDKKMTDGNEVWAAGFPDLLGKPSWQLSKGNISNSRIVVSEIANTDKEWFIQHSASIDPGNSGGPLLYKGNNGAFSVVGINTWTISGRNNVFFSIPSSSIAEVIRKTEKTQLKNDSTKKSELVTIAGEFATAMSRVNTSKNDFHFISYGYGVSNGLADLEFINSKYNGEQTQPLMEKYKKGILIEFFRHTKLERVKILIRKEARKKPFEFIKIIGDPIHDDTGLTSRTLYAIGSDEYTITWKWEDGHWRIYDTTIDPRSDARSTKHEQEKSCTSAYNTCLTGGIVVIIAYIALLFML